MVFEVFDAYEQYLNNTGEVVFVATVRRYMTGSDGDNNLVSWESWDDNSDGW